MEKSSPIVAKAIIIYRTESTKCSDDEHITIFRPAQCRKARVFHYETDLRANLANVVFRVAVHGITKGEKTTEVHNQLLLLSARVNLTRAEDVGCYGIGL